jgi:hypothetical protein
MVAAGVIGSPSRRRGREPVARILHVDIRDAHRIHGYVAASPHTLPGARELLINQAFPTRGRGRGSTPRFINNRVDREVM